MVLTWERRRQYRQLAELDDRLLADIGISRQHDAEEALKIAWMRTMVPPGQ
jgi:uncharacterized protein YjiS (DUF1127 family)